MNIKLMILKIVKGIIKTLKIIFKVILYTVLSYFVFAIIYLNLYQSFFYPTDEKITHYFRRYHNDFEQLIADKEKNCGKYFGRSQEDYYDRDTRQKKVYYWYYDRFLSDSPEAKAFMKRHGDLILELYEDTWRRDMGIRKAEHQSYTFEEALDSCRNRSYIVFKLRQVPYYIKMIGPWLEGPYYSYKYLNYIKNKESSFVKDWQFYQEDPGSYNKLFDPDIPFLDTDTHKADLMYRASDKSSDEYLIHCNDRTYSGFIQFEPDWFIIADRSYHGSRCGSYYDGALLIPLLWVLF